MKKKEKIDLPENQYRISRFKFSEKEPMQNKLIVSILLILFFGFVVTRADVSGQEKASPAKKKVEWAIALHGGAGHPPADLTEAEKSDYVKGLNKALSVGVEILKNGGSSLDAVEKVVRSLEDDPHFNAGKGAQFNIDGGHELHASIMDGRTRNCGGVAAIDNTKNPITLARLVMTKTPYVLLVGSGAEQFSRELAAKKEDGIEIVEPSYFDTERLRNLWLKARDKAKAQIESGDSYEEVIGTVGCVALDTKGNLAAATSTGGVGLKRYGRMGDSAIIGAGNFADNKTCAISCTGIGEHFIRNVVAFDIHALQAYKGMSLRDAVREVVDQRLRKGTGAVVALGPDGEIVMESNRGGMRRAAADSTGRFEVKFYE